MLRIHFVTPKGFAYVQNADRVVLPGHRGELAILPGHAPLVSLLGYDMCRLVVGDQPATRLAIRGGVAWIQRNQVAVVTESIIKADEVIEQEVRERLLSLDAAQYPDQAHLAAARTEARWLIAQLHTISSHLPPLRHMAG